MNAFEDRTDSIDGASIDRLVDGELAEVERRELLVRLDNDPEGWRRCALAFLEDQALRTALAAIAPVEQAPSRAGAVAATSPIRTGRAWLRGASIAASLMASTFAMGFAAGGSMKARPGVVLVSPAPSTPSDSPTPRPDQIREVGSLQVVDGSAGEAPPDRFPIRSGPGLDERWLRSQPPSVPEYLRARWERQGYQVAERRRLMSVELEGGRHVSIPVDEVEVDYVGQQPL